MTAARLQPVRWEGTLEDGHVWMLDQRRLPNEEVALLLTEHGELAEAIRGMAVRGAPAIGVTAAFGVVLAAREAVRLPVEQRDAFFHAALDVLAATRPTAVNLFWALRRMDRVWESHRQLPAEGILRALQHEALAIQSEDTEANLAMGRFGAELLPQGARVLTHCNTGALATSSYGTALGVIRAAFEQGKLERVVAGETRPYLQGARLTAWELHKDGIPVTLITDSTAGFLMRKGEVDCVIVGADRIARNGDVANKIGTYSLAVLARAHGIPFYVAAPTSTIDLETPDGDHIPIEERASSEVTWLAGRRIAPEGVEARHPAFDVTPAGLVTALITERGVARPPSEESIRALLGGAEAPPSPEPA
jgi:methylthioribose-1-phosphate isomerase